jgi:hypothetical protein
MGVVGGWGIRGHGNYRGAWGTKGRHLHVNARIRRDAVDVTGITFRSILWGESVNQALRSSSGTLANIHRSRRSSRSFGQHGQPCGPCHPEILTQTAINERR